MPNPFSSKAGKDDKPRKGNPFSVAKQEDPQPAKKPSPFAVKAGVKTNGTAPKAPEPRNRTTSKERAAAVKAAEKAKGSTKPISNPNNPWVREAFDVSAQVEEMTTQIADYQKQYDQQLKVQKKAKTPEEIKSAFDRGDRLMATLIALSARRRRLLGGTLV